MRDTLPRFDQTPKSPGHVGDRRLVVDLAFEPGPGRVVEDRAADREALDQRLAGGGGERRFELVLRRFQAEQHDAAALRVVFANHVADRAPRSRVRLRLELPPVGLDAERVEALQDGRHRVALQRAVLAGDDLDQQFAADPCAPRR